MNRPLILIVDDEPTIVRFLEAVLHAAGYAVISARCGAEALTLSEDERPDLIVLDLDLMVPGINGLATVCRFHAIRHRVPILLLTDRTNETLRAEQGEVDGALMPPLIPDELTGRVVGMLSRTTRVELAGGRTTSISAGMARRLRDTSEHRAARPSRSPPTPSAVTSFAGLEPESSRNPTSLDHPPSSSCRPWPSWS